MDSTGAEYLTKEKKNDKVSLLKTVYKPYGQRDEEEQYRRITNSFQTVRTTIFEAKKYMTVTLICLTTILLMVILSLVAILSGEADLRNDVIRPSTDREEEVIVSTNCGHLVGIQEDGAYAFKGIPYAKPPLGILRWRKPIPLWTDQAWCKAHRIQTAKKFGSSCFQLNPYLKQYGGKEDCLYVNVWTPTLNNTRDLDVMVWIHGGFFQFGSGNQPGLSPNGRVARELNTVFISFNYRLYALGFLALDLLLENPLTDSAGNYGLWDQLVALQWVRANVRNFGGDPKKITVFGADAGGGSILALMSSPYVEGLFRSAWISGPTMIFNRTFNEVARHQGVHFIQRSGCSDDRCLRKMSPKEVTAAFLGKDDPSFRIRDQNDLPIQGIFPEQLVVIDGQLLRTFPTEASQRGQELDIPVLLGSAAQAVDFWPGPDDLRYWRWNQYKKYITTSLDSYDPRITEMALRLYNATKSADQKTPEYMYTTMVTDVRQTCPLNDLGELLSQSVTSPVYRYVLTSVPSTPVRIYDYNSNYSFHLWEVIAFFDNLQHYIEKPSEDDIALKRTIQNVVKTFVSSGGTDTGIKDWSRYPKVISTLSTTVTPLLSYHRTLCKFWASKGLNEYAWVS